MPHHFHKDDGQWINGRLAPLKPDLRFKICAAYTNVFNEAMDAEPLSHRKMGKARFAANNKLRIYIAKKFKVFN